MKSFENFLLENKKLGGLYNESTNLQRFLEISGGEPLHVFTIVEIDDPKISDYVTVLYDGFEDCFIVSQNIDYKKGKGNNSFRKNFLTFDYDKHSENALCAKAHFAEEAMTIAQLLAALGEEIHPDHAPLVDLFDLLSAHIIKNYPVSGFHPLKDFGIDKVFVNIIKGWEDDYEKELSSEILSKFGMSPGQVASRKFGL